MAVAATTPAPVCGSDHRSEVADVPCCPDAGDFCPSHRAGRDDEGSGRVIGECSAELFVQVCPRDETGRHCQRIDGELVPVVEDDSPQEELLCRDDPVAKPRWSGGDPALGNS